MSLPGDFSQIFKQRYVEWKKKLRQDPYDIKVAACVDEYRYLLEQFDYEELDKEVYTTCLNESNLSFLVVVLYMGNLFDTESNSILTGEFHRYERMRCLLENVELSDEYIELLVQFAAKITNPLPGKSHKRAINICIEYAKDWIKGDAEVDSHHVLKRTVAQIIGSKFFKSVRPSLHEQKDFNDEKYFSGNLAEWLKKNPNRIVDSIMVKQMHNGKVKDITAYRLSREIRIIIRSILCNMEHWHAKFIVSEDFTTHEIFLSEKDGKLEVQGIQVQATRSMAFFDDFKKLKMLIGDILESAPHSPCPEDVNHFLALVNQGYGNNRNALYRHPFVWSDCEVIKNIYLITGIYSSSSVEVQNQIRNCEKSMSELVFKNWKQTLVPGSIYAAFLQKKWDKTRRDVPSMLQILYFMRDSYSHLHQREISKKRCLYKTEKELYAMFPRYIAEFVQSTSEIKEFSGLNWVHNVVIEKKATKKNEDKLA